MKKVHGFAVSLLALVGLLPSLGQAVGVASTNTYTDVVWSVPQLANCTELRVDATGDLNNGTKLSVYGAQNCFAPTGSYPMSGVADFADNGEFSKNLFLNSGAVLQCFNWTGLSGTCQYVSPGTNAVLGTATLTLR